MRREGVGTRHGFTLVEMLVVIAIIGLLAAILVPAVMNSLTTAKKVALSLELNQVASAIEAYKQKYKDYPPNLLDAAQATTVDEWNASSLGRHISKCFPKISAQELLLLRTITMKNSPRYNEIDAAEALVFWLGGLSDDPQKPFFGTGGPLVLVSGQFRENPERNQGFYEFEKSRLVGQLTDSPLNDGDAFPVYPAPYGNAPIVYFEARTYRFLVPSTNTLFFNYYVARDTSGNVLTNYGLARPYKSNELNPAYNTANDTWDEKKYFVNRNTFQLITPGFDGNFGGFVNGDVVNNLADQAKLREWFIEYPSGFIWAENTPALASNTDAVVPHRDNITNFSEGRTLEDNQQ